MSLAAKIINKTFSNKCMQKIMKPSTPAAATAVATVSCVSKDAINCYYYVTQSLKNEKIPEDKRKFVAGLDLSNGILNVTVQSLIAWGVAKWAGWYADKKVLPKYFSNDALKNIYKNINTKESLDEFMKNIPTYKGIVKTGISVMSALIATQIIAKRIIVPTIATPMASYFKEKFEKNEKKKTNADAVTFENNKNNIETQSKKEKKAEVIENGKVNTPTNKTNDKKQTENVDTKNKLAESPKAEKKENNMISTETKKTEKKTTDIPECFGAFKK